MPPWLIVALRLTGLGWYIALCIVGGIVGGLWLDRLTGWTPGLTLLGVLVGSVIAFYGVYRMVLPAIYGSNRPQPPSSRRRERGNDNDGGTE